MTVTLPQIKKYLRIDAAEEEELLEQLKNAAECYLADAISGYKLLYDLDEVFQTKADLLVMVLTAEFYQNRDGRNDPRQDFSFAVRSMMSQLQNWTTSRDEVEIVEAISAEELQALFVDTLKGGET